MRRLLVLFLALLGATAHAHEPITELSPLAPFTGKTWKSVSGSVDASNAATDISKWEWAMHGRAVRITHSVGDGAYGGESLIHWDGEQQKIIFRYVTTAGFYTDGIITPVDGGIEVHEDVSSASGGPTEARSGYRLVDGEMHGWSQFKSGGQWGEVSQFRYVKASGEEPNID